jgi:hypothetical protein
MKQIMKLSLGMITMAAFFTGCGESYQAIYSGTANAYNGCGVGASSAYQMEVAVSSSNPDIQFTINKLSSGDSPYDSAASYAVGQNVSASYSNGESTFAGGVETNGSTDTLYVQGSMSADKSQISGFQFIRNSVKQGTNTPCSVTIRAASLTKIK